MIIGKPKISNTPNAAIACTKYVVGLGFIYAIIGIILFLSIFNAYSINLPGGFVYASDGEDEDGKIDWFLSLLLGAGVVTSEVPILGGEFELWAKNYALQCGDPDAPDYIEYYFGDEYPDEPEKAINASINYFVTTGITKEEIAELFSQYLKHKAGYTVLPTLPQGWFKPALFEFQVDFQYQTQTYWNYNSDEYIVYMYRYGSNGEYSYSIDSSAVFVSTDLEKLQSDYSSMLYMSPFYYQGGVSVNTYDIHGNTLRSPIDGVRTDSDGRDGALWTQSLGKSSYFKSFGFSSLSSWGWFFSNKYREIPVFNDFTAYGTYITGNNSIIISEYLKQLVDKDVDFEKLFQMIRQAIENGDWVTPLDLQQIIDSGITDYLISIGEDVEEINNTLLLIYEAMIDGSGQSYFELMYKFLSEDLVEYLEKIYDRIGTGSGSGGSSPGQVVIDDKYYKILEDIYDELSNLDLSDSDNFDELEKTANDIYLVLLQVGEYERLQKMYLEDISRTLMEIKSLMLLQDTTDNILKFFDEEKNLDEDLWDLLISEGIALVTQLLYSVGTTRFPFSIAIDAKIIYDTISVTPKEPDWSIPVNFGGYELGNIELDLSWYPLYQKYIYGFWVLNILIGLLFLTRLVLRAMDDVLGD